MEILNMIQMHMLRHFHIHLFQENNLRTFETLQIDLTKDENELLMEMHKTNRKQIRTSGRARIRTYRNRKSNRSGFNRISKVLQSALLKIKKHIHVIHFI